jgi:hypothetical protein
MVSLSDAVVRERARIEQPNHVERPAVRARLRLLFYWEFGVVKCEYPRKRENMTFLFDMQKNEKQQCTEKTLLLTLIHSTLFGSMVKFV